MNLTESNTLHALPCFTDAPTEKKPTKGANIAAKIIRIVTLAPIICFVMLTVLYFVRPAVMPAVRDYLFALLFLVAFPLLAYPIHALIPKLRAKGRKTQRTLAVIMSLLGYVSGIITAVFTQETPQLLLIYLTYLFSGILIAFCSFVLKFKASGHFCGVTGPIAMLVYLVGPFALLGLCVLPALVWGTIRLKRHTVPQMIVGSLVPLFAMGIALLCVFL